ncbi:metallophosphoesterase family protein [Halobacillus salinus]|uniref:DNA repair exonuclease n=1 Tax=Halobacillus salinus TaxID=192814 RepID=A0A4Z0H8V9_9BACI|nr:DNA repair exonuclease [Halobacillus salinus]TGB05306.1 DNA repair exonuclease [Halobacillus salinus]
MGDCLRFIHSADLHLDSLFKNKRHLPTKLLEQLRESTFRAFDKLIEEAIQHRVDFVLLVGDLYDEELRSLKAQIHLRNGFYRLDKHGIEVFVSYGNHDYVNGTKYTVDFPSNVHEFKHQDVESVPFTKDGQHMANIYGFSYESRHVSDRKVESFQKEFGPLYHIALLHGSVDTRKEDHDVYAPFTLEELYNKQMDYWALGHIHKREVLSEEPPVVYPGNVQGRSRKEQGEKGCYVVDLRSEGAGLTFVPLHSLTYESHTVRIDTLSSPQQLEPILEQAKQDVETSNPVMLDIHFISETGLLHKWQAEGILDEWVSVVNDGENDYDNWVWIDSIHVTDQPSWQEDEVKKGQHFAGALLREADSIDTLVLDEWMEPVLNHRKLSKHLQDWSEKDKRDILEEAKRLVVDKLVANEEWK